VTASSNRSALVPGAALAWVLALVVAGTPELGAQDSPADSVDLHEEAKALQRGFESYREQRMIPRLPDLTNAGGCDDLVGRLCIRYGRNGDRELEPLPEPVEFGMARVQLLRDFDRIADEIPGDRWLQGQRVLYLGEVGRWEDAEEVARECGGDSHWWCTALLGYVAHARGEWIRAEETFERALAEMPEEEREDWFEGRYLLRPATFDVYDDAEDRAAMWERLWVLSDPLYLVEGNDRKTENYFREVYVRMKRDALNAFGMEWGEDLEEIRLRWGMPWLWTRWRMPRTQMSLQDNRTMGNSYADENRFFLPSAEALESPSDVPPNSWDIDPNKPWGLYTVPYAPEFEQLETQIARFRRGDSLLVVGGFAEEDPLRRSRAVGPRRLAVPPPIIQVREDPTVDRTDRQQAANNPFARAEEEAEPFFDLGEEESGEEEGVVTSALVLLDEESYERFEVRGEGPQGVFRLQVPNGRYIQSVEAWDSVGGRAWRDRHGVWQDDLAFGLAAMSDIVVLRDAPELPESLDEALPQTMPVARIAPGEAFQIGWEIYGLEISEAVQVTIGVNEAEEGLVRRLGQFLRLVEPSDPVDLSFTDRGPDTLGTVFRAVRLNLPDLEPGAYTITVEIELPGREPMSTTRTLEVVE